MAKNKYLKRYGRRFYDSRILNKKEFSELVDKGKKLNLPKLEIKEVNKKISRHKKIDGRSIENITFEKKIQYYVDGKKVSSLKFRRLRERSELNRKYAKGKDNVFIISTNKFTTSSVFENLFVEVKENRNKNVFFDSVNITTDDELNSIFEMLRQLIKTEKYPEFYLKTRFNTGQIQYIRL